MRQVREYIKERQSKFGAIKFFEELERYESTDGVDGALAFVRGLSFFIMAFQDILRLNETRVQDRELRIIARHHRMEDKGHDLWFLDDILKIDGSLPDVGEIFSSAHTVTRDTAYALVGEVFRATDDRTNIALLLVLESTGHVFFTRVVDFLERIGYEKELTYFARAHLEVELGHELFEQRMDAVIDSIDMNAEERAMIDRAVDNSFDAMTRMLEALTDQVRARSTMPPPSFGAPPVSTTLVRVPGARTRRKLAVGG
jgi:hypothetical protein